MIAMTLAIPPKRFLRGGLRQRRWQVLGGLILLRRGVGKV
jgi:hypothetical protein